MYQYTAADAYSLLLSASAEFIRIKMGKYRWENFHLCEKYTKRWKKQQKWRTGEGVKLSKHDNMMEQKGIYNTF